MSYTMVRGVGDNPPIGYPAHHVNGVWMFDDRQMILNTQKDSVFVEDKESAGPGWRTGHEVLCLSPYGKSDHEISCFEPHVAWMDEAVSQGWAILGSTQDIVGFGGAWRVTMSTDPMLIIEQLVGGMMAWVAGPPALLAQVEYGLKTLPPPPPKVCKYPEDPTFREGDVPCKPTEPPVTQWAPPAIRVEDGVQLFADQKVVTSVLDSMYYVEESADGRSSVGKAVDPREDDPPGKGPPVPWVQARASGGLAVMAWPSDFANLESDIRVAMTDNPWSAAELVRVGGPLAWVAGDPTLLAATKLAAAGKSPPGTEPVATASASGGNKWIAPVAIGSGLLLLAALAARKTRTR